MKTVLMLLATLLFIYFVSVVFYVAAELHGEPLMRAWTTFMVVLILGIVLVPSFCWFKAIYNQARVDWIEWRNVK